MKLLNIANAEQTLSKLSTVNCSFKAARTIAQLIKSLEVDLKLLAEKRVELLKKHNAKQAGNNLSLAEDDPEFEGFLKDWKAFLETEIDVDFKPLLIDDLDGISLSAQDIMTFSAFEAPPIKATNPKKLKAAK
jgi:hypothetical protein